MSDEALEYVVEFTVIPGPNDTIAPDSKFVPVTVTL